MAIDFGKGKGIIWEIIEKSPEDNDQNEKQHKTQQRDKSQRVNEESERLKRILFPWKNKMGYCERRCNCQRKIIDSIIYNTIIKTVAILQKISFLWSITK